MKYSDMLDDKRSEVESQIVIAHACGNSADEAYLLGILSKFGLRKEFSKKEIKLCESNNVTLLETDEIPENLFYTVPKIARISIVSERHWTKRVELQYSGDIIAPDKTFNYNVGLARTTGQTEAIFNGMGKMYNELASKELPITYKKKLVEVGLTRAYKVSLESNQSFTVRELGYVVIETSLRRTPVVRVLLDNNSMLKFHINIMTAYNKVIETITSGLVLNGVNIDDIEVKPLCDIKKSREMQSNKYKQEGFLEMDARVAKENREIERMQAEKEE